MKVRQYDVIAAINQGNKKQLNFELQELDIKQLLLRNNFGNKDKPIFNGIPHSVFDFNPNFKEERATFTFTPLNTTLCIQKSLPMISSLHEQNIFDWSKDFINTAKSCNWDDQTLSTVLSSITAPSLQYVYDNSTNITDKLNALFKAKYGDADALRLYNELAQIKQRNFPTIQLYAASINEICKRIAVCKSWNEQITLEKKMEAFYNGLHERTQLEMARLNIHNLQEMYLVRNSTETTMLEQMKNNFQSHKLTKKATSWNTRQNYNNRGSRPSNRPTPDQRPYCSFHKFRGHHTKDCYERQKSWKQNNNENYTRSKETENKNDNPKLFSTKEYFPPPQALSIRTHINNTEKEAIIDTGSAYNYIGEKLADNLRLEKKEINTETAELPNGQLFQIEQKTKAELYFSKHRQLKFYSEFRVLPKNEKDIILGIKFLQENYAVIDIKNQLLTLDNRSFELKGRSEAKAACDILIDKTKIYTMPSQNKITRSKRKCEELIKKYQLNNPLLGNFKNAEHSIFLDKDTPFNCKEYPIPYSKRRETEDEIKKLLDLKVIQESTSNFCSPAFPIYKRNGQIRLVVDFRKLNSQTTPAGFPIPKISDYLMQLAGSRIYSQIDLNSGYYQVQMKKEHVHLTSFAILGRQFEFLRMPFGLCNAPRTFQRAISNIFKFFDFVKVYLDDILVHSTSVDEHYLHLRQVLKVLKNNGLSINFTKSNFLKAEVKYLGSLISERGIKPDVQRVARIESFQPKSKKDASRILGLINWFRPHINKCSMKTAFLAEKTKKAVPFRWSNQDHDRLLELIKEIKSQTLLNFPDANEHYILDTDASEIGVGAVLLQNKKVIGFYSARFTEAESRYTITEKETLAILKSLNHFKQIVFNSRILVKTDNANLLYNGLLTKRIQRWKLQLSEFEVMLQHHRAEENKIADTLSRIFTIRTNKQDTLLDLNEIRLAQENNKITTEVNNKLEERTIKGEKIKFDTRGRIWIPNEIALTALNKIHLLLCHPGEKALYLTLKRYVFVERIKESIQIITKNCINCNQNKKLQNKKGKVKGGIHHESPLKFISSDILGPLKSKHFLTNFIKEVFYILTVTDISTRWTEIGIMIDLTAETTLKTLKKIWIRKFGYPDKLLSDQGSQYQSAIFEDFCAENSIKHVSSAVYNPTGNSVSERANQQITTALRLYRGAKLSTLPAIISRKINNTANRITGLSPFETLYKYSRFDILQRSLREEIKRGYQDRITHMKKVEEKTNKQRQEHKFQEGEFVFRRNVSQDKLEQIWLGPYKIKKKINENLVEIEEKSRRTIQNIKNIRLANCSLRRGRLRDSTK